MRFLKVFCAAQLFIWAIMLLGWLGAKATDWLMDRMSGLAVFVIGTLFLGAVFTIMVVATEPKS